MGQIGKNFRPFIAAVLTATILGVILQTQFVLAGLSDIGAPVSLGERLSMTGHDVIHLGPLYGTFILIGLLVAFLTGWFVFKLAKTGRTFVYTVAGLTAMIVMLLLMKNVFFGVQLIAGARETSGLVAQALAGGVAGFLFARLTDPKPA